MTLRDILFSLAILAAVEVPSARASAVSVGLCYSKQKHWWTPPDVQAFADVGASGARPDTLFAQSIKYAVGSFGANQDAFFNMVGKGVEINIDPHKDKNGYAGDMTMFAAYWGGSEDIQLSDSTCQSVKGEGATNFCLAHGFKDADPGITMHFSCPGLHMEPPGSSRREVKARKF